MAKTGPRLIDPIKRQRRIARVRGQGEPQAPSTLSTTALAEWGRVVALLKEREALDELDQVALADYICCWERLQACEADIAERGVLVPGDRGLVKNPSAQLAREYRSALMQWTRELGFSPSAREKVGMKSAKQAHGSDHFNKWRAVAGDQNFND